MIFQSSLTVVAEIRDEMRSSLAAVLNTMNSDPGRVNPLNSVVPFARLDNLHFARFAILDDETLDEIKLFGKPVLIYPTYLTFLCDFDGAKEDFLSQLIRLAEPGLCRIFRCCRDFEANCDLKQWITGHDLPAAANYFNWAGRTVTQARQERALRLKLGDYLRRQPDAFQAGQAFLLWHTARDFKVQEESYGHLSPLQPISFRQKAGRIIHATWYFCLLSMLFPFFLMLVLLIRLREDTLPMYAPQPTKEHSHELSVIEDWQFTNQFTVIGSIKPSFIWRLGISYSFALIDFAARFFYVRGRLARIRTIHAARWVFVDRRRRVLFASNYDGSLESYMDDFVNKSYFGLNLAFFGGMTYPRTKWILARGARDEQTFKNVLRRHEVPTQVWYDAYPDATVVELDRNGRIRAGLELKTVTEAAAIEWLQLL